VALGIYTGILLSAFSARPFWNSGIMGPLFLVSGLSTAALTVIGAGHSQERRLFTRIHLGLIGVELGLVGLLVINFATGSAPPLAALGQILGGDYTLSFWVLFVCLELLVPLALEAGELRGMRT
jgi:protein NrfD